MNIKLRDIYDDLDFSDAAMILYELLAERPDYANISHQVMPTYERHLVFVKSRPYKHWWLIDDTDTKVFVGSVYLTENNEVGIFIFEDEQGKGYASKALEIVESIADGPIYANVAPTNTLSQSLFEKRGYRLIQYTYKK